MKPFILLLLIFLNIFLTQAQSLISSKLPIIKINTASQAIGSTKVNVSMKVFYKGTGLTNSVTDTVFNYKGNVGIEQHGQSSLGFPQQSYNIEIRNSAGIDTVASLISMPAGSDWVLYAPYNDKTCMRNFITYYLARKTGRYAPRCMFSELIIDSQYQGIYLLIEKIKRGTDRVDISKLKTSDTTGTKVTGGYILKIDKDPPQFTSNYPTALGASASQQIRYSFVYPTVAKVHPLQQAYIQAYVDSFETAFNSTSYKDEFTGYKKYMSMSSMIDFMIMNEVSRNVDGYRLSTYLHKEKITDGNKLKMGPLWDFNLAWYNADYCRGYDSTGWAYEFNLECPGDYWQPPNWWTLAMNDSVYKSNLYCKYINYRQSVLSNIAINEVIDSVRILLSGAPTNRHFTKWPILGVALWPNPLPIPNTFIGEVNQLKAWIAKRNKWLDNNILSNGICGTFVSNKEIETNKNFVDLTIYPNPSNGYFALFINSSINEIATLKIINTLGKEIVSRQINLVASENFIDSDALNINNLNKGLYTLTISTNTKQTIKKVIIN